MKNLFFFIPLCLILCSCAITKKVAPIEYHHEKNEKLPIKSSIEIIPVIHDDTDEKIIVETNPIDYSAENKRIITAEEEKMTEDNYVIPDNVDNSQKIIYHQVQIGETIDEIARQYNSKVEDIAELNDLTAPYDLEEFQILKIKSSAKPSLNIIISETAKEHISREDKFDSEQPIMTQIKSSSSQSPEHIAKENKQENRQFILPLQGKIITSFGQKTDLGVNKGIVIAAKPGTKIVASASGRVIYADYDATFGNLIIIKLHNKNIVTSYAHMQDLILAKGADVDQGDVIGYVGSTGKAKQPQLHFGIREGKNAKDPITYLNFNN